MSIQEIENIAVNCFTSSNRRPILMNCFKQFIICLKRTGVDCTLWVDGSFVTKKVEPDDIDIVVLFDPKAVDALSPIQQNTFAVLTNNANCKAKFYLDAYFINIEDTDNKAYWRGLFSFQRDEETPKGVIKMEIKHG